MRGQHHGGTVRRGSLGSRRSALGRQALDKAQRLGAVGAAQRGPGMAGEAARDVIGRDRDEGAGQFAGGAGGGRVEAVAAQRVLTGDGGVFEVTAQPRMRVERKCRRGFAVGLIASDNASLVGDDELRIAQGAAAQVAGQIQQHAPAMGVALAKPDVPGDAAEAVDEGGGALGRDLGRQAQVAAGEVLAQRGEQFAAKHRAHDTCGQEVAASRQTPLAVGQPAVGDQGVDVRMQGNRARPGMDGEQQAGGGAQIALIGEQFGERLGAGPEQQIGHQRAVEAPPVEQVVRQGEDEMVMRRRQEAGALLRQPDVVHLPRAART